GVTKRLSTFAFATGLRRRYATCATIMCPVSCHASALDCAEASSTQSRSALERFFIGFPSSTPTVGRSASLVEQDLCARAPELFETRLPGVCYRGRLVAALQALK